MQMHLFFSILGSDVFISLLPTLCKSSFLFLPPLLPTTLSAAPTPKFTTKFHAQYDLTSGVLDNGNEWRKFRAAPRLYPLRALVCTLFNQGGSRRAFRLPGAGGGSFLLCGGTFARSYSVSKNTRGTERGKPRKVPRSTFLETKGASKKVAFPFGPRGTGPSKKSACFLEDAEWNFSWPELKKICELCILQSFLGKNLVAQYSAILRYYSCYTPL